MTDAKIEHFEKQQAVMDESMITRILIERTNLMMERARFGFESGYSETDTLVCLDGKSYRIGLDGERIVVEEIIQFIG